MTGYNHMSDVALRALARRFRVGVEGASFIGKRACGDGRTQTGDLIHDGSLEDSSKPLPAAPKCEVCKALYNVVTKPTGKHR